MIDFDIQRFTRRCARSDRELRPGEVYYSVLVAEGADVVRYDYAEAAWEGPPADAVGVWKSQVPTAQSRKMHWAPNDVMLDYFLRLQDDPDKLHVRYVLTLLMIRRRILRWEETTTDDRGAETMVLYCPRNEAEYQVPVISLSPERIQEVQQALTQLLFAEPPREP